MSLSWRLRRDFDQQRHLFYEKIETGYIVETYICSCGHTDFILKHSTQDMEYQCIECENFNFLDANSASKNISHFMVQHQDIKFPYEYDVREAKDKIESSYVLNIPTDINFIKKEVLYSNKSLYTLSLNSEGELKENYSLRFNQTIVSKLEENLITDVKMNGYGNIPYAEDKELSLKSIQFFLKNRHLRNFEFYYWSNISCLKAKNISIKDALKVISNNSTVKTIKKAVFKNYLYQMNLYNAYNSSFIEVFSRYIKDINISVRLINLNLYTNISTEDLVRFVLFLNRHYSDKQIFKFFSSKYFIQNHFLFRDTVSELTIHKDTLKKNFNKVPCKLMAIHDEFVRCTQEEQYKKMFASKITYTKQETILCVEIYDYQIKLPQNGKELFDWSESLHNCMAMYFSDVVAKESIIYGFFKDNRILFAVELEENEIIQASGKYNTELSEEQKSVMKEWVKLLLKKESMDRRDSA